MGRHIAQLFSAVWEEVHPYIPVARRVEVVPNILHLFMDEGCDNLDSCVREEMPEIRTALMNLDPDIILPEEDDIEDENELDDEDFEAICQEDVEED
jgi:hypothetical protein